MELGDWERVKISRHQKRPVLEDYISLLFGENFIELHGDRLFYDDPAIVAGIGKLEGISLFLVGHNKGKDINSNLRRNFGMPHPEGLRKAQRIMKLAERFSLPVVFLVDTPGAAPGVGAEERGQAQSIAECLYTISQLRTPILVVVIGEGGSGGAIAIGFGDRILMLENAFYSVISPEGCAAILWHTKDKAEEAAKALRLSAIQLKKLGIIDEVIKEPEEGAHKDIEKMAKSLKEAILYHLQEISAIPKEELILLRKKRFDNFSKFFSYSPK